MTSNLNCWFLEKLVSVSSPSLKLFDNTIDDKSQTIFNSCLFLAINLNEYNRGQFSQEKSRIFSSGDQHAALHLAIKLDHFSDV